MTSPSATASPTLPELPTGFEALQWLETPNLRIALPGAARQIVTAEQLEGGGVEDVWQTRSAAVAVVHDAGPGPWSLREQLQDEVHVRHGHLQDSRRGSFEGHPSVMGRMTYVSGEDIVFTLSLDLVACDNVLVTVMTARSGEVPDDARQYSDEALEAIVGTLRLKDCSG